jgi:hypothetical protein
MMGSPFFPGPTSPFAAMSTVPAGGSLPAAYAQAAAASLLYGGGTTYMSYGGYGYPYYGMPYYGSPYAQMQAYGDLSGYPAQQPQQAEAAQQPQPTPEEKNMSRLLKASGLPNDNGRLDWPIGLQVLAGPNTDQLRERIDALWNEAAKQAAGGPANANRTQEMHQAVDKLRRQLLKDKRERFALPLAVYQEAERFLDKLDRAEQALRAGSAAPGTEAGLATKGAK